MNTFQFKNKEEVKKRMKALKEGNPSKIDALILMQLMLDDLNKNVDTILKNLKYK